ncbi:MAG: glycosyltransferase family 9 protein [Chlamydiota bacterium]
MKAGVFTASGFGDGLIMMLVANALKQEGLTVVFYNQHLLSLGERFDGILFSLPPKISTIPSIGKSLDCIFLQHDNSPLAKSLITLRKQGLRVIAFYSNHQQKKHGQLHEDDWVLPAEKPIVHGLQEAMTKFLHKPVSRSIGMSPWKTANPSKKVVLHPFSTSSQKNWPWQKFLRLGKEIASLGYEPHFCMSPKERATCDQKGLSIPHLPTLSSLVDFLADAACFIGNDSGPGHLASYMQIPSIILSGNPWIQHWQPGWQPATLITPSIWIPKAKAAFRMRERFWQKWVSINKVLKTFSSMVDVDPLLR